MKLKLIIVLLTFYCSSLTAQDSVTEQISNSEILELDKPPIIRGCNPKKSNEKLTSCLSKKFQSRLNRKLKLSVFTSQDLSIGKHVIHTIFKISSTGEIVDVRVKHSNPAIVNEIKRALGTFKKFEPGISEGKPVNVPFQFPLYIEIFE